MRIRKINTTISMKLTSFLLAISILPLLILQLLSYYTTRQTVIEVATQHNIQLLSNQREYLNLQTDQIEALAENAAWIDELTRLKTSHHVPSNFYSSSNDLDTKMRIGHLLSGYSGLSGLDSIELIAVNGAYFRFGELHGEPEKNDALLNFLMMRALASPAQTIWHGIEGLANTTTNNPEEIIAIKSIYRVDSNGENSESIGMLRLNFSTKYLHDHFNSLDLGADSYLLLVDAQSKLLFHPDLTLIGHSLNVELSQLLKNNSGSVSLQLNGKSVLLSFLKIPNKQWTLLSIVPQSTLVAPMLNIEKLSVVLVLTSLALILLFIRVFAHQVVRPIRAVSDGFRKFQADQLDPYWRLPTSKAWVQISELVIWFNAFLDNMQARLKTEQELRIAAIAFEIQEALIITDQNQVIIQVNRAFTQITGYSQEDAIGRTPRIFHSDRHDEAFYASIWECIYLTGTWQGEVWNRRKCGEIFLEWLCITAVFNKQGIVTNYVGAFFDITVNKQAQEKIQHLAFTDALTELPNRRRMTEHLDEALDVSSQSKHHGALMLIDLDHFKILNDSQGHGKGDLLLKQVAQRLLLCVREGDTVARLGGDEFVIILNALSGNNEEATVQADFVGKKIISAFNQPYLLGDYENRSTPSIGVTLFSGHHSSIEEILKQADLAMYQSKNAGRNTLHFFNPEMQIIVTDRAALEVDLREAVLQKQFVLHYQPQMISNHYLVGAEVLVRWHHPTRGVVSPADFIPLAEETGLILPLGQWILETACIQLSKWANQSHTEHLTLAVNISARQLNQSDFVDQVLIALGSAGANPHRLKLEITESLLVSNIEHTILKMAVLKAKGVGFSLDDFGTGYSSLSYLKRLPLDQLKIDQSFIKGILVDQNDAAIAKMIIVLAESLGLSVIAEGVEIETQVDFLARQGCHLCQGFLFSRPIPLLEFEEYVRRNSAEFFPNFELGTSANTIG